MASDRLDELDYYTLLRVPRDASADAIKRAFHEFAVKYHPDRHAGTGANAVKIARAAQIYRRGAEAYRVLMDPMARRGYDAGLDEGRLRHDPNVKPAAAQGESPWPLRVNNPKSRPFAIKAEQAFKKGDLANAKFNLKLAINHDRENAQLKAALAEVEAKIAGPAAPQGAGA